MIYQSHFLGIYQKEMKTRSQRNICTIMFIIALFAIAKKWKQPKMTMQRKCSLTDKWIKNTRCTHKHTCWNITQPQKGKAILSYATTWISLGDIMLSKITQSQKYKYCTIPLIVSIKRSQILRNSKQHDSCKELEKREKRRIV